MPEPGQQKEDLESGRGMPLEGEALVKGNNEEPAEVSAAPLHGGQEDFAAILERNRQQVERSETDEGLDEVMDYIPEKNPDAKPEMKPEAKFEATFEADIPERKILEQFDKEKQPPTATVPAQNAQDDQDEEAKKNVKKHAQQIYGLSDPEKQIEQIVQLAITHDPYYAVKVAKHMDDNYVMNEIHDRLVEAQVREELLKRGLLRTLE